MSDPNAKPATAEDAEPAAPKKLPVLFDLRLIIGALFTLYGVVLIIAGIADGKTEVSKASGIRINLWAGLGMLVLGLFSCSGWLDG